MTGEITRVGVIGAGLMGAGIAAQVANAGVPVLLLDMVSPDGRDGGDRSAIAKAAIGRMLKTKPAPFMSPDAAALITPGNLEDDLEQVATCQWVVEAVTERLDVKQAVYRRLAVVRRPGTAITSNTSTLRLASLVEGMDADVRRCFAITHFFNPPRFMRLVELACGPDTDPAMLDGLASFIDRRLGKTVVRTRDTPGFIANRLGIYWLRTGLNAAVDAGLTVAEADAAMRPFGIPKTGIFGLLDLIGLDLMPHIARSMTASLPPDDPFHASTRDHPFMDRMIAEGRTGRKGQGGFYRNGQGRPGEQISLASGEYGPAEPATLPPALARDPVALLASPDRFATFAWSVIGPTLAYAAYLAPEIADDIAAIDTAMRLGFNWTRGPFELLDAIGPRAVAERLAGEGREVPPLLREVGDGRFRETRQGEAVTLGTDGTYRALPTAGRTLTLADLKAGQRPLASNGSASLWDIGEGVACLEFATRMNVLNDGVLELMERSVELVAGRFRALVIGGDAADFSAGADLGTVLFGANIAAWDEIGRGLARGQRALKALKYAPFPVVAAAAGRALGGGCEILLHADAIVAHAELYAGLVETGVGLVPGWGGHGELLARWLPAAGSPAEPMRAITKAFEMIAEARVSTSAAEARAFRILRDTDTIVMNRDRLLFEARARAVALAEGGYAPPPRPDLRLPGTAGAAALGGAVASLEARGIASGHDVAVAREVARVLTGGDGETAVTRTEDEVLALEREAFLRLVRTGPTLARIEHMIGTGKPLRN